MEGKGTKCDQDRDSLVGTTIGASSLNLKLNSNSGLTSNWSGVPTTYGLHQLILDPCESHTRLLLSP